MRVIIVNGPMGVGKTVTGKHIAEKNPGTAFIDGDWCMDIHPFVGNRETKAMAVDNILHMIGNYHKCSECKRVVLVWLMDDQWVLQSILDGLSALQAEVKSITLICDRETLIDYVRPSLFGRFEAVLSNGEKVVVSRRYVAELKRMLGV